MTSQSPPDAPTLGARAGLLPGGLMRLVADGLAARECDYPCQIAEVTSAPGYFTAIARRNELAESIVTRVAHALALSPGGDA
jgi:hypothetical protein